MCRKCLNMNEYTTPEMFYTSSHGNGFAYANQTNKKTVAPEPPTTTDNSVDEL